MALMSLASEVYVSDAYSRIDRNSVPLDIGHFGDVPPSQSTGSVLKKTKTPQN